MRNVSLTDGTHGKLVVVAERLNPKGAQVVVAGADGKAAATPLSQALDKLDPGSVFDVLCAQERAFGSGELPPLPE